MRPLLVKRRGAARARWRALACALLAGTLVSGLLVTTPAEATPEPKQLPPQVEKMGNDGVPVRAKAWPYSPQTYVPPPAPSWPAAGSARVKVSADSNRAVRAGGLPVSVAPATGRAGQGVSEMTVQVLDRSTAPDAWRAGLLLRVGTPQAGAARGAASVSVDYHGFRYAYGGDWASRLRLWQLPECALTTPSASGCAATPLPSRNDEKAGVVTAQVPVTVLESASTTREAATESARSGTLVALAAAPSGSSGDFTATSLAPSSTWSSGGSSGDFSWSYPMQVPPAIGGPTPSIGLSYSSSSVDGRSEATNNQPSWIGEGFDYWPGYIERRYVPCAEDTGSGANNTVKSGDLCWRSDNAVMNLDGVGVELVYEAGKGWHARDEDGSRIEKLTGAGNGDNDGEYWKVTTSDGTQYYFGRHSLPGQSSVTDSTWRVPVAGNHSGEPCHQSSFTASFCDQAWRWNLDYVVDVRGNTLSYWYAPETNKYARNLTDSDAVSYTRGGTLTRIDYGTWDRGATDRSVKPTSQVVFTTADRCTTNSCGTHDAANWPDTPWDQSCTGTSCAGKYSPTFWSTKRLSKIVTQVWDTTKPTPDWQAVESWAFTHSFPPPGDGSDHAGLWLDKIVHAGLVGGTVTLPPVTFTPVSLPNRVLTQNTSTNNWQRIDYIITESGAKIDLEWEVPECSSTNLPSRPETNTKRCYPVMVDDPDDPTGTKVVEEWWHKHRLKSISESDLPTDVPGHQAPPTFTYYEYVGAPAWHYADDDGLIEAKRKTWSQFRGYATVKTRVGDVPGTQTLTETRYLRGMHGDRSSPTGGTRTVTVPASMGSETVYDEDQFAGMVREQIIYNGTESKPVSKTVNVPWMSPPRASRTIDGDTVTARFVNTKITYEETALGVDGARGWRTTRSESWFSDTYGTIDRQQDDGDTAVTGDEKCTTYIYNRNTGKNLLETVKQVTTTALTCGTTPTSTDHIISDTRNFYDGATDVNTAPVYGSVTKTEQLKDWSPSTGTVWQTVEQATFDAFGRTASTRDIKGNVVTTAYTPASGGPVTEVTTTRSAPYNWVNTTELNPYWGSTIKTTDQNGRVTDVSYDALGRVWRVWNVGWAKTGHESSPSAEYTYTFAANRNAYPYVTSKVLHAGGGYRTTYEIFDSLLRSRQTQTAGIGGGNVVTDTIYDRLGRAAMTYSPHIEAGNPSGTLLWKPEWSVPAVTQTVFDNASRPTAEIFFGTDGNDNLVEKWRTTTLYEGDLTKVTPPDGATPTTTVVDAHGRTVELRQHTTPQGVNGAYQSTRYTYNGKDQLVKVTDHDGNEWTYTFDVKGRQIQASDPDKGTTTSSYNDYNELQSATDARGRTLWYGYDALGRKTELRENSSTGPLRAKWKYDTLFTGSTSGAKGQLTEAYRYDPAGSTNIYKWRVGGFTTRSQPSSIDYVIPDVEGSGLAGTWGIAYGYSPYDGSPTSIQYPSGGGLTAETVETEYDTTTGLPKSLKTTALNVSTYVAAQDYTALGEPTITKRKIAGGVYVDDATYYDLTTRRRTRTAIQPETAAGTVSDRNYTYDDAGNITSIADTPQIGTADTQCFRHDMLGRLTSAWTPKASVTCATDPTVGNLGGPAPYWLDWTFDAVGNRIKEESHTSAGDTTRTYTIPGGGPNVVRPHAVTQVTTTAPGQNPVTTNYAYDSTGNTICRPAGTTANTCPPGSGSQDLTWDTEGRLATVTQAGNTVETNIYNADGNRLIRRDATGTTLYLPGQEIRRDKSSITTGTRYYTFNGQTIASRNLNGLTWVYSDHQGTQHTVINTASQAVTSRRQTPYGQPRGTQPAWPNPKGFVGGDTDPSGLTHLGAREYDPTLGRFISVDPLMDLANPQQWNGYAYSNNSPITFSDPDGLMFINDSGGKYVPPSQSTASPKPAKKGFWGKIGGGLLAGAKRAVVDPIRATAGRIKDGWTSVYHDTKAVINGEMSIKTAAGNAGKTFVSNYVSSIISIPKGVANTYKGYAKTIDHVVDGDYEAAAASWTESSITAVSIAAGARTGFRTKPTGGCLHSFAPSTAVLLADGTRRAISEVKAGDLVLATDPETGETTKKPVTDLHKNQDTALTNLTVLTEAGKLATLHTTQHHPFWSETRGDWIDAQDLQPTERLHTATGETLLVSKVHNFTGDQTMRDLTVADIHTYYVVAGETPVLVHNCGGTVWDDIKGTQPEIPGTGGLPKSFELAAGDTKVWVHGNASKHIAEYAENMTGRGASPEMVGLGTQQNLRSLQAAVGEAGRGGLTYDKLLNVGGWELKFGAPRQAGMLPALVHARMVG
ncbi:polymorphic toxin-type HINT domain-containing protein [Micromonospora globbae]|uniref:polymorphic toxin-type HINT domain-containing protein n=1 Tax=Micromonospora globbae TaxID=1894969 RepID=UPI003791F482